MKELNKLKEKMVQGDLGHIMDMISVYFITRNDPTKFESEEAQKEFITMLLAHIETSCQLMVELLKLYEEQYDLPE